MHTLINVNNYNMEHTQSINGSNPAIYGPDEPWKSYFFINIPIHSEFIVGYGTNVGNQDKVLTDSSKYLPNQIRNQVRNQVVDRIIMVLNYCFEPKSKNEILEKIGLSKQSKYFIENLGPAITAGLLEMTIPDKPTSKSQKYITTEKGRKVLSK